MLYILGETAYVEFTTNDSTGEAIDADALPTASLVRNGATDMAVTVLVTNLSTGAYVCSFTVPGEYAVGDDIVALIAATVDGVSGKAFRGKGKVDTSSNAVYARVGAPAGASIAADIAGVAEGGGTVSLTIDAPSREVEATSTAYVLLASSGESVEVSIRGGSPVSSQKGYLVFATSLPTPNGQGTFDTPGAFIATNDQASGRYTLSNSVNLYGRAVRRGATVTFVISGEIA